MLTQILTFLIFFAVVGCILYGRRLIRTEKVDAVFGNPERALGGTCLLYTSDAADDSLRVDLGGRRIIKKNKEFSQKREEILEMIWNMEEEIMGKDN